MARNTAARKLALLLPYLPVGAVFDPVPLSAPLMLGMIGLTLACVLAVAVAVVQKAVLFPCGTWRPYSP